MQHLKLKDPQIAELIQKEVQRQKEGLVMIPSENYASLPVLEAMGTVLSNKYAEGYPGKRYYTGNQFIDEIENLAIERAKELFKVPHVNVQPNAGSPANMAAYFACLNYKDKVLGMRLDQGGHLTHGSPVNFSGKLYEFVSYGVRKDTEIIDMDEVRAIALKERPKMIVVGATAYPRIFDFESFKKIADEINAYLLADISHIVGLCLAKVHPDPCSYADVVMTTTHKTLRGPRSAILMSQIEDRFQTLYWSHSKKNLAQRIDSAVMPGLQGGPLEHIIAAKAVCFKEAMTEEFVQYQTQIVKNAKALAGTLINKGLRLVSGGTDNHLILIDLTPLKLKGKIVANRLVEANIYTNYNMIPYDPATPFDPSGIRLGTPALTSRGFKEKEMEIVGGLISEIIYHLESEEIINKARGIVKELTESHPVYQELEP